MWQKEAAKVAFIRTDLGLCPCQTETVPISPKTDPLLAKSEPISDAGGAFVKIYSRNCEKNTMQKLWVRKCERNSIAHTKVRGEDSTRTEILLRPMEKTTVKPVVFLQPISPSVRAISTLRPMQDTTPTQVDVPWSKLQPIEIPCCSELLTEAATRKQEHMQERVFWQKLAHGSSLFLKDCTPWKGPMLEQLTKNCNPLEKTHIGTVHEGLYSFWGNRC